MKKSGRFREIFLDIIFECAGSMIIALALYNFALKSEFPMSGFSGLSMIVYRITGFPMGVASLLLNIPVAAVCYRILGKRFFLKSLRCMVISSVFLDHVAPLFPVYEGGRMLSAICTGVLCGLGYAMIYLRGSSTGGMDFITLSVKAKAPHISLGKITFAFDLGIVVISGLIFQDVDGIIYGLIINYILAAVVDKLMFGMNSGKMTLIVTENGKRISDVIEECCQRGSTIIKALGGYTQDKREIVLCVCSDKQMVQIERGVKEADPAAFIIILNSNEVVGNGFRRVGINEQGKKNTGE